MPKQIFLVRHAQAVNGSSLMPDFDRPLASTGRIHAVKIARKLKNGNIIPDVFISSPAQRTLQTAQLFAHEFGLAHKQIITREEIYDIFSDQDFLDIITSLNNKNDRAMIFGHNPSISQFADYLISDFDQFMPPSAVIGIEFNSTEWIEIGRGAGKILLFYTPYDL